MTVTLATSGAVRALHVIPDRYRAFSSTAAHARSVHNLPADVLAAAETAGLPRVGGPGRARYDDRDLLNLSAALRRRSVWYLAQVGLRRVLDRLAAGAGAAYRVTAKPRCLVSGHRGDCDFELLFDDGPEPAPLSGSEMRLTGKDTFEVRTSGHTSEAPPAVRDVLTALDHAEYLHLPQILCRDLAFFDRTGVANCLLATAVLLRRAGQLGVPARSSFGLLLVPPFAGLHTWTEFLVDGRWVAFDPHLIRLMEKSGVLAPGAWSPTRSLSGVLARFGPINAAVGRHGGNHVSVSYGLEPLT
ncbi:transglutaminase domain-containing protein [Actinoplanes sp. NBRC 103695]|uniref:transglutaminase domain-containing protein n=1 Tax=Actinoplanes sp. NBRC 103695 TaxID=3032202 RepID=UPI0024A5DED5|nr:transglutaminase domain-containing protein [Actinoplanes sp. NBRC 103695]GLZ01178.1 hypothetical protein Acsp02_84290 [Actinoplanes sp. NBRC 103695]